ncbi:GNAT family N-acetyltransferase [Oerskovia sp. M15]
MTGTGTDVAIDVALLDDHTGSCPDRDRLLDALRAVTGAPGQDRFVPPAADIVRLAESAPDRHLVIVTRDDETIALGVLHPGGAPVEVIDLLGAPRAADVVLFRGFLVDHRYQGQGVGRAVAARLPALAGRLAERLGRTAFEVVVLTVNEENLAGSRAYERGGFTDRGRYLGGDAARSASWRSRCPSHRTSPPPRIRADPTSTIPPEVPARAASGTTVVQRRHRRDDDAATATGHLMTRAVVTGIGAVTPLALTASATWEALLRGEHGVRAIDEDWALDLPVRIAARVDDAFAQGLSVRERRRTDRAEQLTLVAGREAWGTRAARRSTRPGSRWRSGPRTAGSPRRSSRAACWGRWATVASPRTP